MLYYFDFTNRKLRSPPNIWSEPIKWCYTLISSISDHFLVHFWIIFCFKDIRRGNFERKKSKGWSIISMQQKFLHWQANNLRMKQLKLMSQKLWVRFQKIHMTMKDICNWSCFFWFCFFLSGNYQKYEGSPSYQPHVSTCERSGTWLHCASAARSRQITLCRLSPLCPSDSVVGLHRVTVLQCQQAHLKLTYKKIDTKFLIIIKYFHGCWSFSKIEIFAFGSISPLHNCLMIRLLSILKNLKTKWSFMLSLSQLKY